jgi:DNA-directed RNA polymerase specialized sigma24 family protein
MVDSDPFDSFVRSHTGSLLRTAYLMTGDGTSAEELVQDTLARLYPRWERVEAAKMPLAYVRRAVVNAYLSQARRRAQHSVQRHAVT